MQRPTNKLTPIEPIVSYLQNNDPDKGVAEPLHRSGRNAAIICELRRLFEGK